MNTKEIKKSDGWVNLSTELSLVADDVYTIQQNSEYSFYVSQGSASIENAIIVTDSKKVILKNDADIFVATDYKADVAVYKTMDGN